jgi:hypothetical protein
MPRTIPPTRSLAGPLAAIAAAAWLAAGCGAAARLGVPRTVTIAPPAAEPAASEPSAAPSAPPTGPGRRTGDEPGALAAVAPEPRLAVPSLIGKTPDEARAIVRAAGFTQDVELRESIKCDDEPSDPGRINCQEPEAGALTNRYAMIHVKTFQRHTFDGDAYLRKVSEVQGMAPDDAKRWLHQLGHTGEITVVVQYQYDAACGQNKVCTYSPARHAEQDITLWINRRTAISVPSP